MASVWLFSACADDLGNYDYHDINEVTVSGNLEAGKMYTKMAYIDSLQFDPIIESTFGIRDDAAYEYEWKLIPVGADTAKVGQEAVLSRERRLNVPLTRKPGDYSGFFIVKDKDSGVSWTTPFFLQLKSISSEGWMILCDESGKTRMDLIFNVSEKEDMVARDIWANETFDPGRPLKLIYNYHWDSQGMLMLVTDKSTYCLDRQDLHAGEENDLKWRFGMVPEEVRLVASGMSQAAANSDDRWVIVDDKGDAWSISLLEYGSVFDYPINRINGITLSNPHPLSG